MGKSTSAQVDISKDKATISRISIEDIYQFLQEDDKGYSRERRLLEAVYVDALSGSKTSMYSANSLLDRGLGKAKESKDLTSGGKPIGAVTFDILDNDSDTEQ